MIEIHIENITIKINDLNELKQTNISKLLDFTNDTIKSVESAVKKINPEPVIEKSSNGRPLYTCPICNQKFEPSHNRQKFCSPFCKKEHEKEYNKNWCKKNRETRAVDIVVPTTNHPQKNKPAVIKNKKVCIDCGIEFWPTSNVQKRCVDCKNIVNKIPAKTEVVKEKIRFIAPGVMGDDLVGKKQIDLKNIGKSGKLQSDFEDNVNL